MLTLSRHLFAISRRSRPRGALARIDAAFRLGRERADLAALDPTRLRDLGLSPEDVNAETARPFWDAPGWWR